MTTPARPKMSLVPGSPPAAPSGVLPMVVASFTNTGTMTLDPSTNVLQFFGNIGAGWSMLNHTTPPTGSITDYFETLGAVYGIKNGYYSATGWVQTNPWAAGDGVVISLSYAGSDISGVAKSVGDSVNVMWLRANASNPNNESTLITAMACTGGVVYAHDATPDAIVFDISAFAYGSGGGNPQLHGAYLTVCYYGNNQ